jgi:hypothetical protein
MADIQPFSFDAFCPPSHHFMSSNKKRFLPSQCPPAKRARSTAAFPSKTPSSDFFAGDDTPLAVPPVAPSRTSKRALPSLPTVRDTKRHHSFLSNSTATSTETAFPFVSRQSDCSAATSARSSHTALIAPRNKRLHPEPSIPNADGIVLIEHPPPLSKKASRASDPSRTPVLTHGGGSYFEGHDLGALLPNPYPLTHTIDPYINFPLVLQTPQHQTPRVNNKSQALITINQHRALIPSDPRLPFPASPDNVKLMGGFSIQQPISIPEGLQLPPNARYCGDLYFEDDCIDDDDLDCVERDNVEHADLFQEEMTGGYFSDEDDAGHRLSPSLTDD